MSISYFKNQSYIGNIFTNDGRLTHVALSPSQGIAQINLSGYESSSEMQLNWYPIQIFNGSDCQLTKDNSKWEESTAQCSENKTTVKMVNH